MDLFDLNLPSEAKADDLATEIEQLRCSISHHQAAYHTHDNPEISDQEYDALIRRHKEIVTERPDLDRADSSAYAVGADILDHFSKVIHEVPMISLENAFSEADVVDFDRRVSEALGVPAGTVSYMAEPKDDGLSCSLIYENGRLTQAATRGKNGVGENITPQALAIGDIPSSLKAPFPERMEVRGEIYMTHAAFASNNVRLAKAGKKQMANCRNAAAGAVRNSDVSETRRRNLSFFAYEIAQTTGPTANTQYQLNQQLVSLGFKINDLIQICPTVQDLIAHHKMIESIRPTLHYDIDGVVYKVLDRSLQARLGTTSSTPRYAIAHKFAAEQVITRITAIDIQIGRTGKLTPVARLEPVAVGGVIISNATLHNEDIIANADIRVGDLIILQRAGDVIPQIVGRAQTDEDRSDRPVYAFPTKCPSCNSEAIRDEDEADRRCIAGLECPAQRSERLIHMASKSALDIDGLGDKAMVEFIENGLIHNPADLFRLHRHADTIAALPGWGDASTEKLLKAIEARRTSPLDRFLVSFGIRHVGRTASRLIARRYQSLASFLEACDYLAGLRNSSLNAAANGKILSEAASIDKIGPEIISSLVTFISSKDNRAILTDLASEMTVEDVIFETTESVVTGKIVVFTGTLQSMSRDEAKAQVERLGGKTSGSISAKTNLLVYGPGAGSKLAKAKSLGITLLTEEEWIAMIHA